jgi:hypothetical protein
MITRSVYETKIKEAIDILNLRISKRTVDLIYEKIKDNFENDDLLKAIDDAAETNNLSYPFLLKKLREYCSIRVEQNALKERRKEELETKQFWKTNIYYITENICNKKCYECRIQVCDLIAKKSVTGIKAILLKNKTVAQVNAEMAKEFVGIGFEQLF